MTRHTTYSYPTYLLYISDSSIVLLQPDIQSSIHKLSFLIVPTPDEVILHNFFLLYASDVGSTKRHRADERLKSADAGRKEAGLTIQQRNRVGAMIAITLLKKLNHVAACRFVVDHPRRRDSRNLRTV